MIEEVKDEMHEKQNQSEKRLEYDYKHHLNEVVKEILAYHKEDGLEKFEEISIFIKRKMTKLSFQYYIPPYQPKKCIELTPTEEKVFKNLNKKKGKQLDTVDGYLEDILYLSRILEWGGISFSKNEWFKIRLAMKKLLVESNAVSLRFWGKIFGTESDYYIIQGSLKNYPLTNPKPYIESRGNEGLNRYTFWVSNSLLEGWSELPDITASQLIASRNFKYYLTGNLNSKVRAFNNFPGKEAHLLKCQILRIMHSSSIVPEGYLKINENFQDDLAGKITEYADVDYQPGSLEDMKTEDKWVHEYAFIYNNGKIIFDTSQEEGLTTVDRLRKIGDDEGYKKLDKEGNPEEAKYWKIKVVGDQMQYTREAGPTSYAAVVINNTRWPGTYCVWKV
jgi:radial spoke head protein 4A